MRIHPQKERASDVVCATVIADRLDRGEHVTLIETGSERRAPVTRSSEGYPLLCVRGIRVFYEIVRYQPGDIDENRSWRRFSGERMGIHRSILNQHALLVNLNTGVGENAKVSLVYLVPVNEARRTMNKELSLMDVRVIRLQ